MSVASLTILSNFFEEQCPQSHPQYLSGLSRALFLTTFLEIAVNVLLNNGVTETNDTIQGEYNANLSILGLHCDAMKNKNANHSIQKD